MALLKLSVGELKRRLFWAGGTVPAGHLEKTDLVAALLQAQRSAASPKTTAETPPPASVPRSAPAPRRPVPCDPAQGKEQEQVTKLFVLSNEELKERILQAGGSVPEGEVSKHFLVAALRSALRKPDSEGVPSPPVIISQPPPPPPAGREEDVRRDDAVSDVDDSEDAASLSVAQLKRRLREYGPEVLVGLSEKCELVAALENSRRDGLPRKRTSILAPVQSVVGPVPSKLPVALGEREVEAQMEEMQKLLAAEAGAAAVLSSQTAVGSSQTPAQPDLEVVVEDDVVSTVTSKRSTKAISSIGTGSGQKRARVVQRVSLDDVECSVDLTCDMLTIDADVEIPKCVDVDVDSAGDVVPASPKKSESARAAAPCSADVRKPHLTFV